MRILAAFGIVYAHMHAPFAELGYLALGAFVTLTTLLAAFSAESRDFGRFMRGRFWRIILPWLVACVVYLVLSAWQADSIARLWQFTEWQSLLVGSYWHLWFLPFIVLTAPIAYWSARNLNSRKRVAQAVMPMALLGAAAMALHDKAELGAPWVQWACAAIPFFYGLILAASKRHNMPLAPVVFIIVATMIPIYFWRSLPAGFLLGAAFLFEVFWRMDLRGRWLAPLGRLSFGVYLVHPLIMAIWYKLSGGIVPVALGAVAVFILSLGGAVMLEVLWIKLMPRRASAPQSAPQTGDHSLDHPLDHGAKAPI